MAPSVGWHPDPTGRYPHRWWEGEAWTIRVFTSGAEAHDPLPVNVAKDQKLFCGICHAPTRTKEWTGRCRRCTLPLTSAYIAARPQQEFKPAALVLAAQVSFDDALAEVDQALAAGDDATALLRLDTAIAYGTVLRAVAAAAASSSKARKAPEPLTLSALTELRVQALRLHAKFAAHFTPDGFELTLLLRLAAMYAPDGRDDLPDANGELLAFCASRVEWIEAECRQVNEVAADYAEAYDWMSLRVALARLGYEIEERRTIGNGPFARGEQGRIEAAALLGVDADLPASVIKKAYYREAAKHHPDRLGEAPEDLRRAAEERMKEINAAYELLTA
jgi:DnaJ-domain-containing protein 1